MKCKTCLIEIEPTQGRRYCSKCKPKSYSCYKPKAEPEIPYEERYLKKLKRDRPKEFGELDLNKYKKYN